MNQGADGVSRDDEVSRDAGVSRYAAGYLYWDVGWRIIGDCAGESAHVQPDRGRSRAHPVPYLRALLPSPREGASGHGKPEQ